MDSCQYVDTNYLTISHLINYKLTYFWKTVSFFEWIVSKVFNKYVPTNYVRN